MKTFFKHYFILLLIDCGLLLLGHLAIQLSWKDFGFSWNALAFSYFSLLFVALLLNICMVRALRCLTMKVRILLLLLNPVNYLGVAFLCFVLAVWGRFEWQGFGF